MQSSTKRKGRRQRPNKYAGYTGIEFLLPIASTLLVYLLSLPIYNQPNDPVPEHLLPEHLLQEVSLASHLEYARQEAVRLETVITVCPSKDGINCLVGGDWHQGWLIFIDKARPAHHLSVGDTLLHRQEGYVEQQPMLAAMDLIQYQADGSINLD